LEALPLDNFLWGELTRREEGDLVYLGIVLDEGKGPAEAAALGELLEEDAGAL
jgi:hypothetical protein